jgi:TRAP-type mannitol/chloroaromatic compound transport system permease small subunit
MPNLTFVLPHWAYWAGLVLFPLMTMVILKNKASDVQEDKGVSLPVAYFLLFTAGFLGVHRLYLRNNWGLVFIPVFIALLFSNAAARDSRNAVSLWKNEIVKSEFLLEHAEKRLATGRQSAADLVKKHQASLLIAQQSIAEAKAVQANWNRLVQGLALLILIGLIVDSVSLPSLKRRCVELDKTNPLRKSLLVAAVCPTAGGDCIVPETNGYSKFVGRLNNFTGTFVAYWSVIAVIVYYYEVIARYVFNSPTNWAHESMFLMFGAQYLIAGGFCLRENAHVRVDVFYAKFSKRKRAAVDLVTSIFFFIFAGTLLVTGWTFFMDSWQVNEVSFTEWGIQYYPIKLSIAAGAILLLLQGVSLLMNDIKTLREPH